jgi:tetratricopeptide (TPR) repeat protein
MAQDICESLKARLYDQLEAMSPNAVTHKQLDSILAEIQHNRGCIATEINEPHDAFTYHKAFNAMMVQEMGTAPSGHDMRLAISWNQLGNAYMLNDDWSKGEECFQKSVDLMRQLDKFEKVSISLPVVNIGLAYWLQGRHEEANDILIEGLKDRVDAFGSDDRVSFM